MHLCGESTEAGVEGYKPGVRGLTDGQEIAIAQCLRRGLPRHMGGREPEVRFYFGRFRTKTNDRFSKPAIVSTPGLVHCQAVRAHNNGSR
jgi:hypothetical protein